MLRGFLRVLCELCVQTSHFFTGSKAGHYVRRFGRSSLSPLRLRSCIQSQCSVAFLARDERKCVEHVFELGGAELIELGHSRVEPRKGGAVLPPSEHARERGDLAERTWPVLPARNRQLFDRRGRHMS